MNKYRRVIAFKLLDGNEGLRVITIDQDGEKRAVVFPLDSNDDNSFYATMKFIDWFHKEAKRKYDYGIFLISFEGKYDLDVWDENVQLMTPLVWSRRKCFVEISEDDWNDIILCDGDIVKVIDGTLDEEWTPEKKEEVLNRDLSEWRLKELAC